MKARWIFLHLLAALLIALVVVESYERVSKLDAPPDPGVALAEDGFLRATHWFGDAWPVNFWNTDLESRAREDFLRARADGFNTIVFLVPWPGFAPDPTSGALDETRVERLLKLMRLADSLGLDVVLRVGYAWDARDQKAYSRLMRLWLDPQYRSGWLAYIESLWTAVRAEPNFRFAFFSWEDLWAATGFAGGTQGDRLDWAGAIGYRDWLRARYTLDDVSKRYRRDFQAWHDVPVPEMREPALKLYYKFIDHAWIQRFFVPALERFPRLSMEIRIDADGIWDGDSLVEWFFHHASWDLPGSEWTVLYWSPSMGGQNQGETLAPVEAARRLEGTLRDVQARTGDRKIFIGQFLVEDFTPGYEMNGRIARDRIDDFLALADNVLLRHAHGVGLWTWADYAHDPIPSPDFHNGLDGWRHTGDICTEGSSLQMAASSELWHEIGRSEYHAPGGPERARICVRGAAEAGSALMRIRDRARDRELATLEFGPQPERRCADYEVPGAMTIALGAESALDVDEVSVTGFVQQSGMRALGYAEKPITEAYRAFFHGLGKRAETIVGPYPDGWMGARLYVRPERQNGHRRLRIATYLPEDWPEEVKLEVQVGERRIGRVPCTAGGDHVLKVPSVPAGVAPSVRIRADRTRRVSGDARQLGCLIRALEWVE